MSNRRTPTLPARANPSTMRAYVGEVTLYAQAEFERGRSDRDVWEDLRAAGTVPRARIPVNEAYLTYLGLSKVVRISMRLIGVVAAMTVYYSLSSLNGANGFTRYILPFLVAVVIGAGLEILMTRFARAQMIAKRNAKR